MKRRFFSFVSIPYSGGPIWRARAVSVLLFVLVGAAGITWTGIMSYRHFRTAVDPSAVRGLELETAILEQKIAEFQEELGPVREKMSSLGELEEKVRSFAGFDGQGNVPSVEVESLSEGGDLSRRLDLLGAEAAKQRRDFDSILDKLDRDRTLSRIVPSIPPTGGWISRRFGYSEDPFTGRVRFHPGVEIVAPKGTPIHATADGTVVLAALDRDLGLLVVLDHGCGYRTLYGHCGFLHVRQGDRVTRGEVIATAGRTGRTTGPCLEYQVRIGGEVVDPEGFFLLELPSFREWFPSPERGS